LRAGSNPFCSTTFPLKVFPNSCASEGIDTKPPESFFESSQGRLELHEIAVHYGDLIDARDWVGLALLLIDDAVFDTTDLGMPLLRPVISVQA